MSQNTALLISIIPASEIIFSGQSKPIQVFVKENSHGGDLFEVWTQEKIPNFVETSQPKGKFLFESIALIEEIAENWSQLITTRGEYTVWDF